jgi:AhpD family alkylhydroperoxidase
MAARLPYLDRAQVEPEVQTLYDALQQASGRVLNIYRLMAHHARSLPPFLRWYPQLREGPLDPKLRCLAYVRASQLNRCGYCVTHNSAAGRRVGVSKEQLVQVDGALVEALKQRLPPEALVQLTLSVAAANFTNRFNEALGTELEFEEARHG